MRSASRILLSLLALLGLFLALVVTADLGRFKSTAESLVSDLTGREFIIGGEFHLHLGRHIQVVAQNVTLANPDGVARNSDEQFASVGRVEVTIDAWSLLASPLLIEALVIENAEVHLLKSESGADNWSFAKVGDTDSGAVRGSGKPKLPVMLGQSVVTNFVVTFEGPDRPPLEFIAADFRTAQDEAGGLTLDLRGELNRTLLEFTATASSAEGLVELGEVDFTLAGRLGEVSFDGVAAIDDLLMPRRPTASLRVQGPNAEYLTEILDVQQVTSGPLDLTGEIAPAGDQLQLEVTGEFGEFEFDATGRITDLQDLADLDLSLAASGPDSSAVARLFGNDTLPAEPFDVTGNLRRSGMLLSVEDFTLTIGESRIDIGGRFDDFPDPRSGVATIRASGPDFGRFNAMFGLPGKLTGPFTLDADLAPLADGGATVDLEATARDIEFKVAGEFTNDPGFVGTRIDITASGPDLRTVTTAAGLEQAPADAFELAVLLERIAGGVAIESGTLSVADDLVSVRGRVGDQPLHASTDLQFDMLVPNLSRTLIAFGRDSDRIPDTKLQASGRVEGGSEGLTLHDVSAEIGDSGEYLLAIDGLISNKPGFESSRITVRASGDNLGALGDVAGVDGVPDQPFEILGTIERMTNGFSIEGGSARVGEDHVGVRGLVADKPLEGGSDITFDAAIADLRASIAGFVEDVGAVPDGPFDASGEIRYENGYFAVRNVKAALAGATLSIDGRLGLFPEWDGTQLRLRAGGSELSRLLPDASSFSALDRPFGLTAELVLRDQLLSLNDIAAFIDDSRLTGKVGLRTAPLFGDGDFSLDAASPNLFRLLPEMPGVPSEAPLDFHVVGTWNANRLTLGELSIQLGESTLVASGTLDGPPNFENTDLRSNLDISSVRDFSVLAGRELPDEAARLTFHLKGNKDRISLEQFTGTLGASDFSGEFTLQDGDVKRVSVGLSSKRLNLAPYLSEPVEDLQPEAAGAAETEASDSDRLIPDIELPMDELKKYWLVASIDVGELNLRQRNFKDFAVDGSLEDGELKVTRFHLASSRAGVVTGKMNIRPSDAGGEALLAIQGTALTLGFPADNEQEVLALPRYDVDTVLHGNGRTIRELAASMDGYMRLVLSPGKLKTMRMRFFTDDFMSSVLGTVNPFAKTDPYANYECAAILLQVKDGMVTGEPAAVVQSEKLRVIADAKINLKTEKLTVGINTVPRKGLGLSVSDLINPYTLISGTLANPTLALDPQGALIEGGAALATGGISILAKSLGQRFLTAKDPCGKAVADSEAEFDALKSYYSERVAEIQ